jgi:hypothetical protein
MSTIIMRDARSAAEIRRHFSAKIIEPGSRVMGASVRDLKRLCRGIVPQSQPEFCDHVKALGFGMAWSNSDNAWIVHEAWSDHGAA